MFPYLDAEQQVLGLDVAMDHVLGVAVLERLGKLIDVCGRALFIELGATLEFLTVDSSTPLSNSSVKHTTHPL